MMWAVFMRQFSLKDQAEVRKGSRRINKKSPASVRGQRSEERNTGIKKNGKGDKFQRRAPRGENWLIEAFF